jgi:hypothetical protein
MTLSPQRPLEGIGTNFLAPVCTLEHGMATKICLIQYLLKEDLQASAFAVSMSHAEWLRSGALVSAVCSFERPDFRNTKSGQDRCKRFWSGPEAFGFPKAAKCGSTEDQ